MNNPTISIIMPMYNTGSSVRNAIESVINQTYKNWQLIIIDDGSTDNSFEVANSYSECHHNISVYHKSNGGLSDARNYGLNYVKGEFIHYFDSDDTIDKNLYSEILKIHKDEYYDIVVFGYNSIYGTKIENFKPQSGIYPTQKLILQNKNFLNFAWNKIYRTNFIKKNKLLFSKGLSLIEDLVFNSIALPLANKIYFDNRCFYNYIQSDSNTLSNTFKIDIINLCIESLKYEKIKLSSLGIDNNIVDKEISKIALSKTRFLFHLIRKDISRKSDRIKWYKAVLDSSQLLNKIRLSSMSNIKDLIIFLCIQLKSPFIINILYRPKYTK